jgi:LPXTG-motif cell wall-anchored protein
MTATDADPATVLNGVTLQVTVGDPIDGPSTVVIALDFQVAALSVTVENDGDAASFSNSPFTVQVDCQLDTDPVWGWGVNGRVMLHFAPDGSLIPDTQSALLAELPVGATCTAIETVRGGATEWGTNPPGTTVLADGAAMVVTNVFLPATLTVTALLGGNDQAAHANQEFLFDASCWFNGVLLPVTATTPATFQLAAGDSRELVVPIGANCSVTETHTWHATAVDPALTQSATLTSDVATLTFTNVFDVDEITVQQTVSGEGADTYSADAYEAFVYCTYADDGQFVELPDDGKLELARSGDFEATLAVPVGATCGVLEDWGLASDLVLPEPIVVALGGELELGIQAVYALGELSVEKDARGQVAAATQYGFETFCTYDTGTDVVDIPLNDFADETYSLADGEAIMFEVLHGAECTTHETQAHDPIRVAVEATGFDASTGDRTATNFVVDSIPSAVLVTNFFVGALPLTGSELSMVALWLGIGVLAAGLALVLIVSVRRRAAQR